jgi:outer membrane protein W
MSRNQLSAALLGTVAVVALTIGLPAPASGRGPAHLRAFGVWVQPDLNFDRPGEEQNLSADADGAFGFGVSGEYQFSDRVGLEIGVFEASPDINLVNEIPEFDLIALTSDGQAMTPVSLGLNIHLLPKDRLDLYLSPFLAYVYYGDLEFSIRETVEIGGQEIVLEDSIRVDVANDTAYGASLGLDIPFSSRPWAIATSLRYLATSLDITDPEGDREKLDFDSWVVSLGLRYTF